MQNFQRLYQEVLRACWTLGTLCCPIMLAYYLTKEEPGHDYSKDWRG